MKKIAVLMSTYNGEKYLKEQLDSIINQKCKYSIDIYIRDDGSTDNTLNIIKDEQKKHTNIYLEIGENIGYNASFFTLLNNINGYDYYAFSDQDDVWMSDKISIAISCIEAHGIDVASLYANCSYLVHDDFIPVGTTQKKIRTINFYNSIIQNISPGHSQVMNNKLREKIIAQRIDYSKIYVYDAWINNVAVAFGNLIFDNRPHTYYRIHANNGFGFGTNKLTWFKERVIRIIRGDAFKASRQIDYFLDIYMSDFEEIYRVEMKAYRKSKTTMINRITYLMNSKLYRQKKYETLLFKCMYFLRLY